MATKKPATQRGKARGGGQKARITARLLLGDGVMEISRDERVPPSTVSTYKADIPEDKFDELRRKKGDRLDELTFDYLTESLKALRKQAEVAQDPKYLKGYGPEGLAILHGVMADKTVRLLELTTRARDTEPANQLTDGSRESPSA